MVISIPLSTLGASGASGVSGVSVSGVGVPGGASVANSGLVPAVVAEVSDEVSPSSGVLAVPAHHSRQGLSSDPQLLQSSRLGIVRTCLINAGFGPGAVDIMLKEHRQSTVGQYQCVWGKFIKYLTDNQIARSEVGLPTVLEFLAFHARTWHREYRTIAAYRCALKQPLQYGFNIDLDSPELVSFMRGFFNENPPARGVLHRSEAFQTSWGC